jgi:hypothetical protein
VRPHRGKCLGSLLLQSRLLRIRDTRGGHRRGPSDRLRT